MLKLLVKRACHRAGFEVRRIDKNAWKKACLPTPDVFLRYHETRSFRHVLDVGANIGQTAKSFSRWFPGAIIHSLEPFSAAFEQLQQSTGSLGNIRAYRVALSESDGDQPLYVNSASVTNSLLPASPGIGGLLDSDVCSNVGMEHVPTRRLTTFCQQNGIAAIDLLKIDAQGFENRILRGAGAWLNPTNIRLIFLEVIFIDHYQGQATFDDIYGTLCRAGYKLYGLYQVAARADVGYLWADALFVPSSEQSIDG